MPMRLTVPGLGTSNGLPLKKHQWQVDLVYRNLHAPDFYIGTVQHESSAPFGQPIFINVNSLDVSVNYGVTDRVTLTLTLPFSYGTHSRTYPDMKRHEVSAGGLGDINWMGNVWLWNPASHKNGNLSLGLGVKAPSGDNAVTGNYFVAGGANAPRPVDQAIELGDGGWGLIMQAQGFQKISNRVSGYGYGFYLLSPKDTTNVISPYPGVPWSVPDVYSARLGAVYAALPKHGFSVSLGPRIDGTPVRDLVGSSDGFRRPGYVLYLDPGMSLTRRRSTFTLDIPVRVYQDFQRSLVDIQLHKPGGGDFGRVLLFAGYSVRFGGSDRGKQELPAVRKDAVAKLLRNSAATSNVSGDDFANSSSPMNSSLETRRTIDGLPPSLCDARDGVFQPSATSVRGSPQTQQARVPNFNGVSTLFSTTSDVPLVEAK